MAPSRLYAYHAFDGKEHQMSNYEVLTGTGFRWVQANNGKVPTCAIPLSEKLFVGRVKINGETCVGSINADQKKIYAPYGFAEHIADDFEVLCK